MNPAMNPAFEVHMLNERGKVAAGNIAILFNDLLAALETDLPNGRELAIVKTKLEEACFFAKKAVASNPDNQAV